AVVVILFRHERIDYTWVLLTVGYITDH
ncbi:MAG: hypothetical protein RL732_839, partial [Bacteroidota bacterium]